jgi:mono/diheme cytochrome c family protein
MRSIGLAIGFASLTLVFALGVTTEPAMAQRGEQLYADNCALCHKADGTGLPPGTPALAGNDNLQDLQHIVTIIHQGEGGMLAFPDLTADEIAALAAYIRNAWGNDYGTSDEVAAIFSTLPEKSGEHVSVWDGVYTQEQDARGKKVHSSACARCHGLRLNGAGEPDMPASPAIARASFLNQWNEQTLAALFEYVRTTMPTDNPGMLTDQEYIDSVAHMLAVSNMPPGSTELPPDIETLAGIVLEEKP